MSLDFLAWYAKNRGLFVDEAKGRRAKAGPRPVSGEAAHWKQCEVTIEGRKELAFSIGALAAVTQRSIQSLRAWERAGLIPGPDARSPKGDRLYSVSLIERIYRTLEEQGRLRVTGRQHAAPHHLVKTIQYADGTTSEEPLFLLAALAKALSRTNVTIQSWVASGVLPDTPFRVSVRRYRLYTAAMIQSAAARLEEVGEFRGDPEKRKAFHDAVAADWDKLRCTGASVVEP